MKHSNITPTAEASQSGGDKLRARANNAICRLQDAVERGVVDSFRAKRIAKALQGAMDRPGEQPVINGAFWQYSALAYLMRDYRYAIDSICAGPVLRPRGKADTLQSTYGMGGSRG